MLTEITIVGWGACLHTKVFADHFPEQTCRQGRRGEGDCSIMHDKLAASGQVTWQPLRRRLCKSDHPYSFSYLHTPCKGLTSWLHQQAEDRQASLRNSGQAYLAQPPFSSPQDRQDRHQLLHPEQWPHTPTGSSPSPIRKQRHCLSLSLCLLECLNR